MIEPEIRFWGEVRRASIAKIATLCQRQLDYSPDAGDWSVAEVIDHVLRTECLYRGECEQLIRLQRAGKKPQIRRSFSEIDVGIPFLPSQVMPAMGAALGLINPFVPQTLRNRIIRSRAFRALSPRALLPVPGRPRSELLHDLESQFEQTRKVFDENPGLDYSEMVHRHPAIGINTVPQLIHIAALHEQRHQEQVDRILESPGFPPPEGPDAGDR